jgi:hypothetical protein
MQISRGLLSQVDTRPPKSDALNFVDWVSIARLATEFCDEHGRDRNPDASGLLPGWAAETLGFVVLRSHRPLAAQDAPDLESLLTILRLLRRYRANPAPDRSFFVWVGKQLALQHRAQKDSVILAEIVGELVPQLPQEERGRFARRLFPKVQETNIAKPRKQDTAWITKDHPSVQQLLRSIDSSPSAGIASIAPLEGCVAPSRMLVRSSVSVNAMKIQANTGDAKQRLWARLSPPSSSDHMGIVVQDTNSMSLQEVAQVEQNTSHLQPEMSSVVASSFMSDSDASLAEASDDTYEKPGNVSNDIFAEPQPSGMQLDEKEVRMRLEAALERVAILEKKLEERSSELRGEVANLQSRVVAAEMEAKATPKFPECSSEVSGTMQLPALPQLPSMPQFASFHNLHPDTRLPTQSAGVPARSSTLHLRRPFNFEEFRRAETQGLQNTRLRVLVPPDPMQPFSRK